MIIPRAIRLPVLALFAVLAAAQSAAAERAADGSRPIAVFSQTVPLDPRRPDLARVGELTYRGGIALRSTDRRFGGFSGLHVSTDGRSALAVSDRGNWLSLALRYDADGRLAGAVAGTMGPLIGENGFVLQGRDGDTEDLVAMPDGSMLVPFERRHRILHYPPAARPFARRPAAFPVPAEILRAPGNAGIEALVHVGSGFLVAIAERLGAGGGAVAAWVGRGGAWEPFAYVRAPGFRPTAAGLLPGGDLLVIEHRYTVAAGSVARLVRVARREIAPHRRVQGRAIAILAPPLTSDNFEGVAIRRGAAREALIYVISDDNFNPLQRTLLMVFALPDG